MPPPHYGKPWICSLGWTSLTLTCSLIGLLTQTVVQMDLLAQTLLPKIGLPEQIELASVGLFEQILLPIIGLLGRKIIVLTCFLKLTSLP